MALYTFKQGYTYIAGVDKPLVLPASVAVREIEDMGFRVYFADECQKMAGGTFPFAVPGRCGDEWDWVGVAERIGPTEAIDVPGRVKWIQEVPKPLPAPPPGQPMPPPPQQSPAAWMNPEQPEPSAGASSVAKMSPKGALAVAASIGGVVGLAAAWWLHRSK